MDLEIINLVKQHGYSIFWLIIGVMLLIRLSEWAIRHFYKKIEKKLDIVQQGICEIEQPTIISNKSIFDIACDTNRKVEECYRLCKDSNEKIAEFCISSHESRNETKILVESIRAMIDEISHDVQRISDESGNVYKLIAERLLNGYRNIKNGS